MHLEWSEYINTSENNNNNSNTNNYIIKTNNYIANIETISKDITDYIKSVKDELDFSDFTDHINDKEYQLLNNIQDFDYKFSEKIKVINNEILNYENNDTEYIKDNSINKLINLLFNKKTTDIENFNKIYLPDIKFNNYFNDELRSNEIQNNESKSDEIQNNEIQSNLEDESKSDDEIVFGKSTDSNSNSDDINMFVGLYKLMKNLKSYVKDINNTILINENLLEKKINSYKEIIKCKEMFESVIINENDDDSKLLINKLYDNKINELDIKSNIDELKDLILNKKKYLLLYNILQLPKINNLVCSICFCDGEYVCFVPCGHTCCIKCMAKILYNKCHVCRTPTISIQKVYFG